MMNRAEVCGQDSFPINKHDESSNKSSPVVALVGNPNTGKSTLFNALTGLRQHTGNWPGKTVLKAQGSYTFQGQVYTVIDLPGTYSLKPASPDEAVTRDYLCLNRPQAALVVADATCLERNLNLVLQVMEITSKVVVCVNLMDEAARQGITVHTDRLQTLLGVPVIPTAARNGTGIPELRTTLSQVIHGHLNLIPSTVEYSPVIENAVSVLEPRVKALLGDNINVRWVSLRLLEGDQDIRHILEYYSRKHPTEEAI